MAYDFFISYRRNLGGISQAGEIRRILVDCVGEDKVFRDIDSMGEGNCWPMIESATKEAKHFILLINTAFFEDKKESVDWYFKEISTALSRGFEHITPIFYDGMKSAIFDDARMPEAFKKLRHCRKLVYNKDNATHFDLFVRDHFGLVKQGEFEGYGEMNTNSGPKVTQIHNGDGNNIYIGEIHGNVTF